MRLGGASDDDLAGARAAPFWDGLLALAPTLAYDAAVLGDDGPPSDRLANIRQETLVLTRSTSDPYMPALPVEFFAAAADAVATALPTSLDARSTHQVTRSTRLLSPRRYGRSSPVRAPKRSQ